MSPPPKLSAAVLPVSESKPFSEYELSSPEEFERLNRRLTSHSSIKGISKQKKQKDEKNPLQRKKKVARRRKIDPTTSNRDYSLEEIEFMNALNDYKHSSGRMFPTCCEILEVLKGLGYEKMMSAVAE